MAFQRLFEAIQHLPDEYRSESLTALSQSIRSIPQAARSTQFRNVLGEIGRLSHSTGGTPLAMLTSMIAWLPAQERGAAFADISIALQRLPAKDSDTPFNALLQQFEHLPSSTSRTNAVDQLIASMPAAHTASRGARLTALAVEIGPHVMVDASPLFDRVFDAIKRLPPVHRGDALAQITLDIVYLPPPLRIAAFEGSYEASSSLIREQRGTPLAAIAHGIPSLPIADHAAAFDRVVAAIDLLPDEPRAFALSTLGDTIMQLHLPPAALGTLFDAIKTLSSEHQIPTLMSIIETGIRSLDDTRLSAAHDIALEAIHALPDPLRVTMQNLIDSITER